MIGVLGVGVPGASVSGAASMAPAPEISHVNTEPTSAWFVCDMSKDKIWVDKSCEMTPTHLHVTSAPRSAWNGTCN